MARLLHSEMPAGRIGVFVAVFCFISTALGQEARDWRLFTADDGMGGTHTTTVTLAPRGEVVFTHREGGPITLFDGYEFQTNRSGWDAEQAQGAKSSGASAYRVLMDNSGVLWTVYPEGLAEWKDGVWSQYKIPEIQRELKTNVWRKTRLNWVQPLGLERVLFLLPGRLMEFNAGKNETTIWKLAAKTRLGRFSDLAPSLDGGLWISGENGLARLPRPLSLLQRDTTWEEFIPEPEEDLHNFQRPFPAEDGGVAILADQGKTGKKVIVFFDGHKKWKSLESPAQNVRLAWAGLNGSFWAATIDQLFHRDNDRWTAIPKEVISPDAYLDAAVETNGVFWLATSDGAYRFTPSVWRAPPHWARPPVHVYSFCEDSESQMWVLQQDALTQEGENSWTSFAAPPEVSAPATNGVAWAMTDGSLVLAWGGRMLQFDPAAKRFLPVGPGYGAKRKVLGRLEAGKLCVQTFERTPAQRPWRFEYFDGKALTPCQDIPEDLNVGDELRFVYYAAQSGDIWVGGSSFIALRRGGRWKVFAESDEPRSPSLIMEAGDGKIWVSGIGGIFQFDGRIWSPVQMPSGWKGVNAMTRSSDGRIWVASNTGLWRFFKDEWTSISVEEGLPGQVVLSVFEDSRGRVWAGTSKGVSLYNPESDPDPPRTRIRSITTDQNDSTEVVFDLRDKWKVTSVDRLYYSYNVDNSGGKPFLDYRPRNPIIRLSGLSSGKHDIYVRGMDRNLNVESFEHREFSIPLPWYLDLRLISISAAAIVAVLFFAVLALNRHLRLLRSYAEVEKIVALRTEQLEKANRGLLQSQKMNALGALAAGVAHDFNNVLSIIKGSAQIIEANLDDRDKIRLRLSRIKTVVNQGAAIVKAMLGFSRESEEKMTQCDINAVVEETIQLLGDHALDEVKLEFNWAPGLPLAPGFKDYIQQILLNFVFNARDAMNGRGRIFLQTGEMKSLPPDLALAPNPADFYLYISVKDSGAGIPSAIRTRIFEPFFTTKAFSTQRGTGLGLSMVYEMARRMGCGLHLQSEVGQGSTFTVVFPVISIPAAQPPPAPVKA